MNSAAWLAARPVWQMVVLSLACGGVMALGQAPSSKPALMLLMLLAAFVLYGGAVRTGRTALVGWLIGVGYFATALSWITEPFQVDATRHAWMAPFALAGLAAGLALFWALAFAVARSLMTGALGLAVTWPAAELARAYVFTGFPWAMLPQGLLDTPVVQGLAWGGPHGMMLFLCLGAAWMAQFLDRPLLVAGPGALALSLVVLPFGTAAPEMTEHTVRLVQPNAAQRDKWNPQKVPVFLRRQLEATAAEPPVDLVIWPETAVPYLVENASPIFEQIAAVAGGTPVVLGIQRRAEEAYFNSVVVIDAKAEITQTYDKYHLVPFGEYMPLGWIAERFGLVGLAQIMGGGYARGAGPQVLDFGALGLALPLICYEAVFAHDVRAAPTRPAFLMQVTNDAWFGDKAGPQQHLAQARMRAIEQGLPMARSANTGISAMIGPRGRILDSLPLGVSGHVDAHLPKALPPTLYARTGDLPVAILLLLGVALLRVRRILIDARRLQP